MSSSPSATTARAASAGTPAAMPQVVSALAPLTRRAIEIPNFTGEAGETATAYLRIIDKVARYNRWDPEETSIQFMCHLKGKAEAWLGTIPTAALDDWQQLKQAFTGAFASEKPSVNLGTRLKEMHQLQRQSVEKYAEYAQKIMTEAGMDLRSDLAKELLVAGLEPEIQVHSRAQMSKPLSELVSFAAEVESVLGRRKEKPAHAGTAPMPAQRTTTTVVRKETTTPTERAQRFCTYCNIPGHDINVCRNYARSQQLEQSAPLQPTRVPAVPAPTPAPRPKQPVSGYSFRDRAAMKPIERFGAVTAEQQENAKQDQ